MLRSHMLANDNFVGMLKLLSDVYTKNKVIGYLHITGKRYEKLTNNDVLLRDIYDLQNALVKLYCKTDFPKYKKIREECKRDDGQASCRYQRKAFTL